MSEPPRNQFTSVAEVYDSLMAVVPYGFWVEYVELLWKWFALRPRRVLDLACGTGSVLYELILGGYEAEGADASAAMLAVAARKLPAGTRLWEQDARELRLPGPPFDACVCLFDSLNYLLEPDDLRRAFRGVYRHLVPGGSLVFDMNSIRALETGMFNQRGTGEDASLEFEWHSAWEPAARLCTIRMEFRTHGPDGTRVFHETHVQRGYTQEEVVRALQSAGFSLLGAFDAYTTRPPTARSDRLFFVAQRPADAAEPGSPAPEPVKE